MAKKEREENNDDDSVLSLIGTFISTFVMVVILLIAAIIVLTRVLGWNLYSIDSGSMTPAYPVNTLMVVKEVDPSEIQVGDVITFLMNEEGQTATHRVIGIDSVNQTFTTKGDANETADPTPVRWGNVVGRLVFALPGVGSVLRVLTAEENRVWVISILAGLFVLSIVWDIAAGHTRKKKQMAAEISLESDGITQEGTPPQESEDGSNEPPDLESIPEESQNSDQKNAVTADRESADTKD